VHRSRSIAARAGRWSAQHRRTAILGWVAFVVLAVVIGGSVGTRTLPTAQSGVGESGQASKLVDDAYPKKLHEAVLIRSTRYTTDAPQFHAAVEDLSRRLDGASGVTELGNPYARHGDGQISKDRHAAALTFEIPGATTDAAVKKQLDATIALVADRAYAGLTVEQLGDGSSAKQFMEVFNADLKKAEGTSIPLTLILLVIAFGTLVAAGIPLVLALTGVAATFGLVGPLSQIAPIEESIKNVVLLIGLAVGVDYSLFYLRRVREERAAGRDARAAIEAAAATSGRAVLISGITVMTAMSGMFLAGAATFTGWATGTITVVAVSVLGSLTVLPAVLSKLGERADKGRVPGLARLKRRMAAIGMWSRVVDRVMRRPLLSVLVAGGLLVALAIPGLSMTTGEPGTDTLPQDLPVVQTFNHMHRAFPSETNAMSVVLNATDVRLPEVKAAVDRFNAELARRSALFPNPNPAELRVSPDHTVGVLEFGTAGDGTDTASRRALDALRDDIVPATLGSLPGVDAYVDGAAAQTRDFADTLDSHLGWVVLFVLGAAFVLLTVTFRSLVIPIKAIVLNLLSVGAAYGVLSLVFNRGWGNHLLGFSGTAPIVPWLPVFMFVVLFGLSMDYHVFILSRVREAYDGGMKTEDAVSHAIKSTAGVVTSAAAVMVCVFAIFGTLSFMLFKQMGVGLAFAVLIDATLVRAVLLPATMKLLGDRTWWLPSRLSWLPGVDPEPSPGPAR